MIALIIVLLLIVVIWFNRDYIDNLINSSEHYLPCNSCDNTKIPSSGVTVLNPFIWPYSATSCLDGMYMQKEIDKLASGDVPLTSSNTPDHVIQTN